ncbi:MAG TPA: cytochrome c peroxidase [Kofleriaceae bacterium]|nr:cytochrome c peroxidase [Kofleriaceae bacterium]
MRLLLALAVAMTASLAACADTPDDVDTAEKPAPPPPPGGRLSKQERDAIAQRIRALMPGRGIVKIPTVNISGGPARRDALVALGRALVFDKVLSDNHDISCMTCHPPQLGGDDDRHLSMGVRGAGVGPDRAGGIVIPRNAPPPYNLHALDSLFWDGRVERLPDGSYRTPAGVQLTPAMTSVFEFGALSAIGMFPVTSPDEMREHGIDGNGDDLSSIPDGDFTDIWDALMDRLRAIPQYRRMFGDAYPQWPGPRDNRIDTMTFANASNAMAAYLIDTFTSNDSPWDDFVAGHNDAFKMIEDTTATLPVKITEEQVLLGAERFLQTCANCHNGPLLSDNRYHNTALAQLGPGEGDGDDLDDDFGRERVTTDANARCGNPGSGASCRYAFRTSPLRNVLLTAPYGHAGEIGHSGGPPDFVDNLVADYADLRAFVAHYSVNPAQNLRDYDVTQVDASLQPTLLANVDDIIANIDPLFANGSPIVPGDIDNLTAFMVAQTSKALLTAGFATGSSSGYAPCDSIPASVPSGLPVDGSPDDAFCYHH